MAGSAAEAPSTHPTGRQIASRLSARIGYARDALEHWLEAERDQIGLWLPVMLGMGIALWFALPRPALWVVAALVGLAAASAAGAIGRGGRASRIVTVGALAIVVGLVMIGWRAERIAAPVLARPAMVHFSGRIERIEPLVARGLVRLTLRTLGPATDARQRAMALPARVRVNVADKDMPAAVGEGGVVRLGARLMPPAGAAVPGAYDFARVAWFVGIGGTGRGFAPVTVVSAGREDMGLRRSLTAHITARVPGSAGGVAAALATGDTGSIAEADAEAMRAAGLAHLLSVSGLHITAVVGATMVLVIRLLALIPALALRVQLPLVAAAAGAGAAVGYTLLTGSEVPTIRSCLAALLVLAALALGREAMTLRLVAAGALVVLMLWPEALAGPSFQLSFAAITAIVALHEHPALRRFGERREERGWRRLARALILLLATGVVVEAALMPIAVYHFHRTGLYGALANIVAIPLTTFVIMPLELLALMLDAAGAGAPMWWLAERSLNLLLWLARIVAASPGAVTAWPAMPDGAFALMIAGGLWIALWRTQVRRLGALPLVVGLVWAVLTPPPDLLVTGDGRHASVRLADGQVAMLRDRAGDYMRDVLAANGGVDEPVLLGEASEARCTRDLCVAEVGRGGRRWRVMMTRSSYMVPVRELIAACRDADVVVSERRLPRGCTPRWLRLDRNTLARTGGLAVTFDGGRVVTVRQAGDAHPWIDPPRVGRPDTAPFRQSYRRNMPDSLP